MSKGKQGYGLNSRRTDTQAFAPQRAARNGQPVAAASGAPEQERQPWWMRRRLVPPVKAARAETVSPNTPGG
jgi:hypothetical protein